MSFKGSCLKDKDVFIRFHRVTIEILVQNSEWNVACFKLTDIYGMVWYGIVLLS